MEDHHERTDARYWMTCTGSGTMFMCIVAVLFVGLAMVVSYMLGGWPRVVLIGSIAAVGLIGGIGWAKLHKDGDDV